MTAIRPSVLAVLLVTALVASVGVIGADLLWLVALGREIVDSGDIPDGVPFAAAPSSDWPNVPVLAELSLWAANGAGERGLLAAQVLAVGVALVLLARDARHAGASEGGVAVVLLVVGVAAFETIVVVRLQLFSLVLFPALLLLLRAEARRPSRRIWLLVPLIALWSNLHGAVLAGLAVAGAYLVVDRVRRRALESLLVLLASIAALAATPALDRTPAYYRGVLENEAAKQGFGLWEPLSLTSPTDLLLVAGAVVLLVAAARARPRAWELVAMAGLAVLTLRTARSGVWLLYLAATPAACGLAIRGTLRSRVSVAVAVAAVVVILGGLARGPIETGAGRDVLREGLRRAGSTSVVADAIIAEQVAEAGGRVWMSNPLDAFDQADQRLYVDWLDGEPAGDAALSHARRVVLVRRDGSADDRLRENPSFRRVLSDDHSVLYLRVTPAARSANG